MRNVAAWNVICLFCLLEPHAGFKIAFNMFDADGNEMVDKREFMVVRLVLLLFIINMSVRMPQDKFLLFFHLAGRDIPQEKWKEKRAGRRSWQLLSTGKKYISAFLPKALYSPQLHEHILLPYLDSMCRYLKVMEIVLPEKENSVMISHARHSKPLVLSYLSNTKGDVLKNVHTALFHSVKWIVLHKRSPYVSNQIVWWTLQHWHSYWTELNTLNWLKLNNGILSTVELLITELNYIF